MKKRILIALLSMLIIILAFVMYGIIDKYLFIQGENEYVRKYEFLTGKVEYIIDLGDEVPYYYKVTDGSVEFTKKALSKSSGWYTSYHDEKIDSLRNELRYRNTRNLQVGDSILRRTSRLSNNEILLSVSSTTEYCVIQSGSGDYHIMNIVTGDVVRVGSFNGMNRKYVSDIAWNKDEGNVALYNRQTYDSKNSQISVVNTKTGKISKSISLDADCIAIGWYGNSMLVLARHPHVLKDPLSLVLLLGSHPNIAANYYLLRYDFEDGHTQIIQLDQLTYCSSYALLQTGH